MKVSEQAAARSDARSASRASPLEPWLCLAWAAAALATLGLMLDRHLERATGAFALTFWWWPRILLVYVACGLGAWLLLDVALSGRVRLLPARAARAIASAYLIWAAVANAELARSARSFARVEAGALLVALAAALVALGFATAASPWARRVRWIAALVAPMGLGAAAVAIDQRLERRAPAPAVESLPTRATPPLLVIGLDGADWKFAEKLIARGDLPNLAALRARGAWGDLATIKPTESPAIWTSMVTGRTPLEHGVRGHMIERPGTLPIGLPSTPFRVRYLGLNAIRDLLYATGQIVHGPVTAAERRAPAIWNIATFFRRHITVSNWWATWPAESIFGRIVSDRVFYDRFRARGGNESIERALTFPESLLPRMRRLVVRPTEITYESARRFMVVTEAEWSAYGTLPYRHHDVRPEFRLYYATFATDLRFARELLREDGPVATSDTYLLFRLIDHVSHCCLSYSELVDDHLGASADDLSRFGGVTSRAYREIDDAIGELLVGRADRNILLLSDHGFTLETGRDGKPHYSHETAPPGIFLGAGPSFRPGHVEGIGVYDIFPLLLHLHGFPAATDSRGSLPGSALVAHAPDAAISSYDFLQPEAAPSRASRADEEILDQLRALGYL